MILSDREIVDLCVLDDPDRGMIHPFTRGVSGSGVISYGLCSAGYDLRLAEEVIFFRHVQDRYGRPLTIDPKSFADKEYSEAIIDRRHYKAGDSIAIPPNSYVLGHSYEYLRIPRFLKARCVGKSTYARSGILINTTPLEPAWEGHLTIEIGNVTPHYAIIYCMEGIAQLEFEVLSRPPEVDYREKGGKYQGQQGVTPARVL